MTAVTKEFATKWLDELKAAWEAGDGVRARKLFARTQEYYERPFRPGTTQAEIAGYWADIDELENIRFDYAVSAINGPLVVVHWQNSFTTPNDNADWLLDGVFFLTFDDAGDCVQFRQWWFARD